MKLIDVLKKYVIPSILTTISIDSYRRQIGAHSQELDKLELIFIRNKNQRDKNKVIQQIQTEL
jgi:hypothetical protein